jgi:hypothetical protein
MFVNSGRTIQVGEFVLHDLSIYIYIHYKDSDRVSVSLISMMFGFLWHVTDDHTPLKKTSVEDFDPCPYVPNIVVSSPPKALHPVGSCCKSCSASFHEFRRGGLICLAWVMGQTCAKRPTAGGCHFDFCNIWRFPKMGFPKFGRLTMENPITKGIPVSLC